MDELTPFERQQFEQTWSSPPGIWGLLKAVNNQPLGQRIMIAAFSFFLVGGLLAMLMCLQLTVSGATILGPRVQPAFTMHGRR